MTYPYRCTTRSCRKYVTLKKKKEEYIRTPHCKDCGGNLSYSPQMRKKDKKRTCTCDAYPFPHKKTTSVWCKYHPTGPTEEDWEERYSSVPKF